MIQGVPTTLSQIGRGGGGGDIIRSMSKIIKGVHIPYNVPIEARYPIEAHPPFREQKLQANVYICNKMERLSNQNDIYKIFIIYPFSGTILAPVDWSLQTFWPHNRFKFTLLTV